MRFIITRAARLGLMALLPVVFGPINNVVAQNLDLDSFLAPVQGGSEAVQGDVEVGDTVHAETMQDGLNAANGLLAEDGDGVLLVSTKTGLGTIARASASYNTYQNINATMLSKRGGPISAPIRRRSDSFWSISTGCRTAVKAR